jgi:predicted CXXCH cytochrome family protein
MRERPALQAPALAVSTLVLLLAAGVGSSREPAASKPPARLDPSAWGSDHVGKPVPESMTGDECLFCHRDSVGRTWSENRHQTTIRAADEGSPALAALKQSSARDLAGEVGLILGHDHRQRFLRAARAYGKLDLLSVDWTPPSPGRPGRLGNLDDPHWDADRFAASCAGCHATAVDPREQAFASVSLDCYVCHGLVPAGHTENRALALLSRARKNEARVVTSICAQCHVRSGHSRSTGRPYATNFVAGDNLFKDFQVDLSDEAVKSLSPADRHVVENVRDVVVVGKDGVTCLSCHDVHGRSSKKHHRVAEGVLCLTCHNAEGPRRVRKPFSAKSKTCGY